MKRGDHDVARATQGEDNCYSQQQQDKRHRASQNHGRRGSAAVCRADEKQIEYKSRRMRRELATTPAWVLSWGIEMAKTENRKPKTARQGDTAYPRS